MIDSYFWKRVARSWAKDSEETTLDSLAGDSSLDKVKSFRDQGSASGVSAGGSRAEEEEPSWFDMSGEEIGDMLANLGLNDF
ncbi:MAG: hypothetical protein LUE31_07275 [Lachnospiraceae bacterium]|nr:hypothetical protein [Lachnospiraceae bacterium]